MVISQNPQNSFLRTLISSSLFHFLKVYINGDMVGSDINPAPVYKYLSQDWETKAGIGMFWENLPSKKYMMATFISFIYFITFIFVMYLILIFTFDV